MQFLKRENTEKSPCQRPYPSDDAARFPTGDRNSAHPDWENIKRPLPRDTREPANILSRVLTRLLPTNPASESQQDRETDHVNAAAAAGEISEYDLFRAAWFAWYGTEAESIETEKLFGAYLNGASLPVHVRHFVRRLICAAKDPALDFDRERFGLGKFRRKEPLILF